jgi:NADH-quinone oxidoreductase subunit L
MFRLLFLTFHCKTRLPRGQRGDLRDPDDVMMWPLYLLAVLTVFGGLLGMPQFWGDMMEVTESDSLGLFLSGVVAVREPHLIALGVAWQLVGMAFLASLVGFGWAFVLYISRPKLAVLLARVLSIPQYALARKLWVDEIYDTLLVRPLVFLSDRVLFRGIDVGLIDEGLVGGTARAVRGIAAHGLKYAQSGLAQAYLLIMVAGTVALLAYLIG